MNITRTNTKIRVTTIKKKRVITRMMITTKTMATMTTSLGDL